MRTYNDFQDDCVNYIPCPSVTEPWSMEFIEQHARECIIDTGLAEFDWYFDWDRAIRRLGCCHYHSYRITLSVHFAEKFRYENPTLIHNTILHEIAHALAYMNYGETGHGVQWHYYCMLLGAENEKSCCKCDDFAPQTRSTPTYRYALCHCETGEVFRRFQRCPRRSEKTLARTYIKGRKDETLGKLTIVKL